MSIETDMDIDVLLATHTMGDGSKATLRCRTVKNRRTVTTELLFSFENESLYPVRIPVKEPDYEEALKTAAIRMLPLIADSIGIMNSNPTFYGDLHYSLETLFSVLRKSQVFKKINDHSSDDEIMMETVKTLAENSRRWLRKKEISEHVSDHVKFFDGKFPSTEENLMRFFDIVSMQDGVECYQYWRVFPEATNVDFKNEDVRKFFHLAYSVICSR